MSPTDPPGGEENPFGGDPFGELAKLFGSLGFGPGGPIGGGDPWRQARQIAAGVVADGSADPNVDPKDRIAVEESLARIADLHIREVPGVSLPPATTVRAVTRTEWTEAALDAWRPFFERFGEAVGTVDGADSADPMAAMMSQMFSALGPVMVAASAGSMIGHLGQRALGQYDLPIPRPSDQVMLVPRSVDALAERIGRPVDDVRLVVLLHELATHAVLRTPHVSRQLESLLIDFAAGFRPNVDAIGAQFADITDLSQLTELSETLNDPDTVLDLMRSPGQDLIVPRLDALVAAVLGFVDFAVRRAADALGIDHHAARAAIRERLADPAPADRFTERLLGLSIDGATFERGDAFITGVTDRAGDEALDRLWADELDLPTAAEIDAPGLWLARIGLDPDLPGGTTLEIPDDLSGLDDL